MPNITISLDKDLLKAGRQYASEHNTSINALIRKLLEQMVNSESKDWIDECFKLMDRAKVNSKGRRWKREDLYDV
ncbi:DUF6364 family protein [Thermodesulfobacteriota bacterium]